MMNTKASRTRWKLLVPLVAVTAVTAGFFVNHFRRPEVPVQIAVRGKAITRVPGTVVVQADYLIELKSEVGGRVVHAGLEIGKRVNRGEVLVRLDTGDLDLEIARIKNEIVAARKVSELGSVLRPEVENFQMTLEDLERQAKAGAYPVAELEKQKRLHRQLALRMELEEVDNRLKLENLQTALQVKERERAKTEIVAPRDGIVTAVFAGEGDVVGGNAPIANLVSPSLRIEAKFSEEHFASVRPGQRATVRFFSDGAGYYEGVVTKVLPSADPQTQRYTVYLDVVIPEDHSLVPGITGEAFIITGERENALLIPRRALAGGQVYVVAEGKLERRRVVKGYDGLHFVEILEGLHEGEAVVVDDLDRHRDGDHVRVKMTEN